MTLQTASHGKPRVSGEIDAYCTKCRLDLNHRIIAMVGEDVKKVECLTCHGHHVYRRTLADREKEKERKAQRAAIHGTTPAEPRKSKASSKAASPRTERSMHVVWERAISGQPPTAFKAYTIKGTYNPGELVRHTRFGDGVIARVIDPLKVEIIFEDGPRTMAQGMPA
ncbi:MAG: hypothetical protein U0271_43240 [Polyangiaceae bacterium]